MSAAFASIALAAEKLAQECLLAPEARQQMAQTERVWRYRSYQGGEPIAMIDWRQSARGEKLLVREAEVPALRPVYLWQPQGASPDGLDLLLAAGLMLAKSERVVGWLGEPLRRTRTPGVLKEIVCDALKTAQTELPAAPAVERAVLLIAGDFASQNPAAWQTTLRTHAARGNRVLFMDFSARPSPALQSLADSFSFPVLKRAPGAPEDSGLVLRAFIEVFRASAR